MGADQQFCLRWNNFHTNITSAFESLRDDEDFVDITLACEGRQVKAHKMVLSACSPYFRSLLKGNPCQHPIVFLKDVTFANLASILDFMYHGEVNVSHNELATFLKTAEALKVRGLAEDDKKKDSDGYIEGSSPGPPRDPPDPGASPRPDDSNATDTRLSDSPPPHKKQRRRSGASVQSAEDTNETVNSDMRETSVKNEPQEFIDDDDMLGHSAADSTAADIKADNSVNDEGDDRNNFGLSDSVSISRSQAAMQQLQESFGSFLPAMSQSSGFLPHGATEMPRPPFPLEGVQGLPPGISTLPGPSMSQAGASQDTSQGGGGWSGRRQCGVCGKLLSSKYALQVHMRDVHSNVRRTFSCCLCGKVYASQNSYRVHMSLKHRNEHPANYPVYSPQQQQQPHRKSPHSLGSPPLGHLVPKQEVPSPSAIAQHDIHSPSPHSLHEIHASPPGGQRTPGAFSPGSIPMGGRSQMPHQGGRQMGTVNPSEGRILGPPQCMLQNPQVEQKEAPRNNPHHPSSSMHGFSSCSQAGQVGSTPSMGPFSQIVQPPPPQPQQQQQSISLDDYAPLAPGVRLEGSCMGPSMDALPPMGFDSLPSHGKSPS